MKLKKMQSIATYSREFRAIPVDLEATGQSVQFAAGGASMRGLPAEFESLRDIIKARNEEPSLDTLQPAHAAGTSVADNEQTCAPRRVRTRKPR